MSCANFSPKFSFPFSLKNNKGKKINTSLIPKPLSKIAGLLKHLLTLIQLNYDYGKEN